MNGVSRFLSRRDKHHEKRSSKHLRSKVQPPFLSSPNLSQLPLLSPLDSDSDASPTRTSSRRRGSLGNLYHKLPAFILPSAKDGFPFLKKKPPSVDLTPLYVHVSTNDSSDYIILQSKPVSSNLYTIFSNEDAKTPQKEDEKKIATLTQRLKAAGITSLGDAQIQYALSRHPNDLDEAYDLLVLANDSFEGILRDYDPSVKLLGAINRNMVTCYLDALLFAMFARLDSFEAMLFDNFSDEPRKKLAGVLRLWVNLLRTGRLINVDLTKHLQDALGNCGWEDATRICQQDASEAFTFITGALELPLLTLKMDIYHTGREDKEDDHKFVNERLLEVAIPEQQGDKVITLEDCLEEYFNNRIEVKRYLQRQNTVSSVRSTDKPPLDDDNAKDIGKGETIHIETVELASASDSPLVQTPTMLTPTVQHSRPVLEGRRRADSIFSERYTLRSSAADKKSFDEKKLLNELLSSNAPGRPRSASLRKEVMMPAWQFFSLIPWYTDNVPKTDAQVAAHFSAKRPVLGICLKRYSMTLQGTPIRLNTFIDIPLEIGLPHFISDDRMDEEGPLFGNFKLVLQSVVCHRGVSVDSGHYISLVRANVPAGYGSAHGEADETPDSWLRFDDLAPERVTQVDIKDALTTESPYLLFYQVQPIDEELANRGDPPPYAEARSGLPTADPSRETLVSTEVTTDTETAGDWEKVGTADLLHIDSGTSEEPIGRSSFSSNRRSSVAFEDLEARGRTAPPTPSEVPVTPSEEANGKGGILNNLSRRNSKTWLGTSKSRPSSQSGENRLSLTLSRLTGRGSKDKLQITDEASGNNAEDPVIVINEVQSAENGAQVAVTSPVKEQGKDRLKESGGIGVGRSKSKRSKRLRSKSRDPAELVTDHKGKHKAKERPDRECMVM